MMLSTNINIILSKYLFSCFVLTEVTSIRSGLRKRKRAESPQPTEPQITEEWVEEDKLELWEIKLMGEKAEKAKLMTTRSCTMKNNEILLNSLTTNSSHNRSLNGSRNEESDHGDEQQASKIQKIVSRNDRKTNQTLKIQGNSPSILNPLEFNRICRLIKFVLLRFLFEGSRMPIGNRSFIIKNLDGSTRHIHSSVVKNRGTPNATANTTEQDKSSAASNSSQVTNSTIGSPQQKVQIVRCTDGRICVRGLLPSQQLVQTPDGKLHVLTTNSGGSSDSTSKYIFYFI